MPDLLVGSFAPLLLAFESCFTQPSFRSFWALSCAWILCSGRRSLTRIIQAAQLGRYKHFCSFHRFFSQARWNLDDLGHCVFQLLLPFCSQVLVGAVDDTLARKSGRHIWGAGMHHDPLRSTQARPVFAFGHNWVVFSLHLCFPFAPHKTWAFPLLVRLYRKRNTVPVGPRSRRQTRKETNRRRHRETVSNSSPTRSGNDSDCGRLGEPAFAPRPGRQRVCRWFHQSPPARQHHLDQPHDHERRPV